jgi:hypothetical protein
MISHEVISSDSIRLHFSMAHSPESVERYLIDNQLQGLIQAFKQVYCDDLFPRKFEAGESFLLISSF